VLLWCRAFAACIGCVTPPDAARVGQRESITAVAIGDVHRFP